MSKLQKAVSLRYPENADAPYISSQGKGLTAQRIIRLAEENGVPVIVDEALVNVLSIQSVGELIPEAVYEAVAKVFAFVQGLDKL